MNIPAARYYDVTLAKILEDYDLLHLYVDVGCQYSPHLRNLDERYLPCDPPRCLVPWFHAKGHNQNCQLQYSGLYEVILACTSGYPPLRRPPASRRMYSGHAVLQTNLCQLLAPAACGAARRRAVGAGLGFFEARAQAPALHGSMQSPGFH